MRRSVAALSFLLLTTACAQLPELQPTRGQPAALLVPCTQIFPLGDWQLLHTIEADLPNGKRQTLMGLSQLSSEHRTGQFVMMTIEGLVLFEARLNGDVEIKRAVPPFDRQGMAAGIIEDLELIFFPPYPAAPLWGTLADGAPVCRFTLPGGGTLDIVVHNENDWVIRKYNGCDRTVRTVQPMAQKGRSAHGMPNEILLEAPGPFGYRLRISLIEAQPLTHSAQP